MILIVTEVHQAGMEVGPPCGVGDQLALAEVVRVGGCPLAHLWQC